MNAIAKNPLHEVVERAVRKHMKGLSITAVHVRSDRDEDGDNLLRILVVYDTKCKVDVVKAKSLVRHIFHEIGSSDAFPVIAFRSASDHKRLSEAA